MKILSLYKFRALLLLASVLIFGQAQSALAFCGFYVAKADTDLFNEASKVVLVRDGNRTVLTMANDFQGDVKDFAMVVPVPTVLEEGQIHVGNNAVIDHLDAYTAPRLVEYFDDNPCHQMMRGKVLSDVQFSPLMEGAPQMRSDLGVTIEAEYQIGEYDILLLSAKQSDGLLVWLSQNGYQVSSSAKQTLGSYIKQGLKFFVARVNLDAFDSSGQSFLRPIQIAYESKRFMLPIRLGMENAKGDQELFVFALTREGRVETTNYRTEKLPSELEVPTFVKRSFDEFYKAMFAEQVRKSRGKSVFTEYAWDMNWCDPCAADPLSQEQLRELGVFWVGDNRVQIEGQPLVPQPRTMSNGPVDVFVTRLHVRYNKVNFPEDLMLQVTPDRKNFQGRYIIRHEWDPSQNEDKSCKAAADYVNNLLPKRYHDQASNLAKLTGWSMQDIKAKMEFPLFYEGSGNQSGGNWWDNLWKDQ
jgi:hypothetical protein